MIYKPLFIFPSHIKPVKQDTQYTVSLLGIIFFAIYIYAGHKVWLVCQMTVGYFLKKQELH